MKRKNELTAVKYAELSHEQNNIVTIGGWQAKAVEIATWNNNKYSKAYHRRYGAVREVHDRYVQFVSPSGHRTIEIKLDSWRGNWQMKALIDAKIVKPKKGQMHIRLNAACDIKKIGVRFGYTFYLRTLKGEPLDYCAVSPLGQTFHAESPSKCIAGIKKKMAAIERRKVATIDWDYLRNLGFCKTGIIEFCDIFGFNPKDRVSPQEVYDRVMASPKLATPFLAELKKLADSLDFELGKEVINVIS
jgi:hypothetical protein